LQVKNAEWYDCSWWNVFCWETDRALAARAVGTAMDLKLYCGGCSNGLPPGYVAPSEPVYKDPVYEEPVTDTAPSDGTDLLDTLGSCTSAIYADYNLVGGDIDAGKPVADAGECCLMCHDRSNCFAW
jgi:hypothetical protein